MFLKAILLILIAVGVLGESTSNSSLKNAVVENTDYVVKKIMPLIPRSLRVFLLDGPDYVSNAPTGKENKNILPTVEKMSYYMNYAGSTYYDAFNLSCECCLLFKHDLSAHKGLTSIFEEELIFEYNPAVVQNALDDTLALVTLSIKQNEIVVAFRGTNNTQNVVLDAVLTQDGYFENGIRIHVGFQRATLGLYNRVVEAIRGYREKCPNCKIVSTGHSLGAAMARIAYYFFVQKEEFPSAEYELYTYGEPRGGNKHYALFMNAQPIVTARCVNRRDIVPHLPPVSILGKKYFGKDQFLHSQTEYYITGGDDTRFCSNTCYEDPTCSMSNAPAYSLYHHDLYFNVNLHAGHRSLINKNLPLILIKTPMSLPRKILRNIGTVVQSIFGIFH